MFKKAVGLQAAKEGTPDMNTGAADRIGGPGLELGMALLLSVQVNVSSPVTVMLQAPSMNSPVVSQCIL